MLSHALERDNGCFYYLHIPISIETGILPMSFFFAYLGQSILFSEKKINKLHNSNENSNKFAG